MVALASPVSEIIPNPQQAGRIVFQLTQAAHQGRHNVTKDSEGFHVLLDTPVNLEELGNIPNRMADPYCAKITVQDLATCEGQILAYDARGVLQFKFGHPAMMVAPIFKLLSQKRGT